MIHPCECKEYNGGQCYNCLNGAHDICVARKCKEKRAEHVGLRIVVKVLLLALLAGSAHAGMLDLLRHGVPGNPDVYASIELLGTKQRDSGVNSIQGFNQASSGQMQGMRGQFTLPLDQNSSFLFGGGWQTGDYSYDQTSALSGEVGQVKSYNIEAGFRFYIHE